MTRGLKSMIVKDLDKMFNMNFKEHIYDIYRYLPPSTQVVLVSATFTVEVLEIAEKCMDDPVSILVKRDRKFKVN